MVHCTTTVLLVQLPAQAIGLIGECTINFN